MSRVQRMSLMLLCAGICVLAATTAVIAAPAEENVAAMTVGGTRIDWRPLVEHERLVLTVSGPGGLLFQREFARGEEASFDLHDAQGNQLPSGSYAYQIEAVPAARPEIQKRLAAARERGDAAAAERLVASGRNKAGGIQAGTFAIHDGAFVPPGLTEERSPDARRNIVAPLTNVTAADQVIPDDLIVQGSICAGFDCVNNENFGFDTIRLKENNLRIKFEDTSVGTFPTNDWQLTANDSASGGASKFSIEDITGAKVPFTVTAGASTNSIFVDSTGRVGLRTSTPVLDLHINTSNTPAIRLEQNSSGGFTAQTWDIGANEANFFVRDVTSGSRLPFRIRPGAPTSSVDISADGDVGIGTGSPDFTLHVSGSDGNTKLLVDENNGTATDREVLELENNGPVAMGFQNSAVTFRWAHNVSQNFVMNEQTTAGTEMTLTNTGNMTISGTTYATGSSRDLKENFKPVDEVDVLERLVAMPLTEWNAKNDPAQRHIGPVAEDWFATFGLGPDDKHVTTTDLTGVALAAIKGLYQMIEERDAKIIEIAAVKAQNAELQQRLDTEIAELRELLERSIDQQ